MYIMCVCVCWQLWRVSDGSVAAVLRGHRRGVWSVKFSPVDQVTLNLRILIVCTIYCVNQRSANRMLNPSFPLSLTYPPTLQCVLTASGDTTLKLWAVSDGSCIKTFEGHTMSVLKAIFLSRGMQIASRYIHVHATSCYIHATSCCSMCSSISFIHFLLFCAVVVTVW